MREHGGWRKGKGAGSWFFLLHPEGQKNLEMGCDFVQKKSVFPVASPDSAGKDVAVPTSGSHIETSGLQKAVGRLLGVQMFFF